MEAVSALAVTCLSLHSHKCHLNSVTSILTFFVVVFWVFFVGFVFFWSSTIRIFLSLLAHQEDSSIFIC